MLNQYIPCHSLQGRAPLQAYPDAAHSGRLYRPEWEGELLDLTRVWHYLATGRWFRHIAHNGTIRLGSQRYYVGTQYRNRDLELTADPEQQVLLGQPEGSDAVIPIHLEGMTRADLLGELSNLVSLPSYQLALPLSAAAWRELEYAAALSGTT